MDDELLKQFLEQWHQLATQHGDWQTALDHLTPPPGFTLLGKQAD